MNWIGSSIRMFGLTVRGNMRRDFSAILCCHKGDVFTEFNVPRAGYHAVCWPSTRRGRLEADVASMDVPHFTEQRNKQPTPCCHFDTAAARRK